MQGRNRDEDIENRLVEKAGERRGGGELTYIHGLCIHIYRESSTDIYTVMCKIGGSWKAAV